MEYEKALAYSEEELDALDYLPGSDFSRDRSGVPENIMENNTEQGDPFDNWWVNHADGYGEAYGEAEAAWDWQQEKIDELEHDLAEAREMLCQC